MNACTIRNLDGSQKRVHRPARVAAWLLSGILAFLYSTPISSLELAYTDPHRPLEMECWIGIQCHTRHTGNISSIMLAEVQKTIPSTTPKEILVECARCPGEFNDTVCYRTATTVDFNFSDKLADLGEEEFGMPPNACGTDTEQICFGPTTCDESKDLLQKELSQNSYASPLLDLKCEQCPTKNDVACFTASCSTCFIENSTMRIIWEARESLIDPDTKPVLWEATTCEDTDILVERNSTSGARATRGSAALVAWHVSLGLLLSWVHIAYRA